MGTAFSKGKVDHLPHMRRLNATNPGDTSCGVLNTSFQEVTVSLVSREERLWADSEEAFTSFDSPQEGQLLCIVIGAVTVYVDHTGKVVLVDHGEKISPRDIEEMKAGAV